MRIFFSVTALFVIFLLTSLLSPRADALFFPQYYSVSSGSSSNATTGRPSHHSNRKKPEARITLSDSTYRNRQRTDDVKTLINAIYYYMLDHNLNAPSAIPLDIPIELCASNAVSCGKLLDLRTDLEPYLKIFPRDPQVLTSSNGTGYGIYKDWKGRVIVLSLMSEDNWIIKQQH